MARGSRGLRGREQVEPGGEVFAEAAVEFGQGEFREADGREFDGERDAVEVAADGFHRAAVGVVEGESGGGGRAFGEQGNRVVGDGQRIHVQDALARQAELLPAGDEDAQPRQDRQQGLGERHAVREHMFAGVEDQQQPLALGPFGHHLGDRSRRLVREPQRLHDGQAHQSRGVQCGELHQPYAVGVGVPDPGGGPCREPCLADPADPDEAHKPADTDSGVQLPVQPGEFLTSPDETPRLRKQIAGTSGASRTATAPARPGLNPLSPRARLVGHTDQSDPAMLTRCHCPTTRTERRQSPITSGHLSTRCDQLPVGEVGEGDIR